MTNQNEKTKKKLPGDTMIGFGITLAVIGVGLFVITAAGGGSGGFGLMLLLVAFALTVIGYLQRIAARR